MLIKKRHITKFIIEQPRVEHRNPFESKYFSRTFFAISHSLLSFKFTYFKCIPNIAKFTALKRIRNTEEFCLLRYNAMYTGESQRTFLKNKSPPPSGSESDPSKKPAGIM
jgi:hypothetical protein